MVASSTASRPAKHVKAKNCLSASDAYSKVRLGFKGELCREPLSILNTENRGA